MPTPERRILRFESLDDLERELDRLEAAHRADGVTATGAYSPGQNLHHLARWVEKYETGDLPVVPLHFKVVGRLIRGRILNKGFPTGLKGPDGNAQPEPETSFEDGLAQLRAKISVLREKDLAHKNPFFGRLSHEDVVRIHLRHSELHLGFIRPRA